MNIFKSEADRQSLLEELQTDMNEEFRATLQYICHRILAKGNNSVLSESFKSAALDEMSHILFFSDLITKYGGTIQFDNWDTDQSQVIEEMIKKDLELEQAARERYSSQIEQFRDHPEVQTLLKSVLADEEDHEVEFTRYLKEIA